MLLSGQDDGRHRDGSARHYGELPLMPADQKLQSGVVKFLNDSKGYGFIESTGDDQDIFFHATRVANASSDPKKGDKVTFVEDRDRQGRTCARQVRVVK